MTGQNKGSWSQTGLLLFSRFTGSNQLRRASSCRVANCPATSPPCRCRPWFHQPEKPLISMLVATTCRIQRWPTNLMKLNENCLRRNAFQPLAPGLSATPSSHKRPPPVPPPVAVNLGLLLQRFPKKPLQHWSRFIDSKRAPIRAPFRGKVCQTGSATGQVVFHDQEEMRPRAHRIMTVQDRGW